MNFVKDEWLSKELGLNAYNIRNLNLLNNNFLKKKKFIYHSQNKKKKSIR